MGFLGKNKKVLCGVIFWGAGVVWSCAVVSLLTTKTFLEGVIKYVLLPAGSLRSL